MGKLLIVPYGIETNTSDTIHIAWVLLIVPYGIETVIPFQGNVSFNLLIVPYGIETIQQIPCLPISFFF